MIREIPFTTRDYNRAVSLLKRLGQSHIAILIFLLRRGETGYNGIRANWEGDEHLLKKALSTLKTRELVRVYNSKYRLTYKGEVIARALEELLKIHLEEEGS